MYQNFVIQNLLRELLEGRLKELKPSIGEEVTYQDLQKVTGLNATDAEELLKVLVSEEILLQVPSESLFICSHCNSIKLLYRLKCSACKSTLLNTGRALEHMYCGYIDMEKKFFTTDYRCPKCRKELKAIGVDYRSVGDYYYCMSCNELNSSVDRILMCMRCGHETRLEDAVTKIYYSYVLNPDAREKLVKYMINLSIVAEKLHSLDVKLDSKIKGKSGAYHNISIIASRNNDLDLASSVIVETVISAGEIEAVAVLNFMAKIFDIGSRNNILAVVPKLNEEATKLSRFYGIKVIESENTTDLPEKIAIEIEDILNVKEQKGELDNIVDNP